MAFYVYILTNPARKVLYTGVTNNLYRRLIEHWEARGSLKSFTGKYYCYEKFDSILTAIAREKKSKDGEDRKRLTLLRR
jgi:putative endonuclease